MTRPTENSAKLHFKSVCMQLRENINLYWSVTGPKVIFYHTREEGQAPIQPCQSPLCWGGGGQRTLSGESDGAHMHKAASLSSLETFCDPWSILFIRMKLNIKYVYLPGSSAVTKLFTGKKGKYKIGLIIIWDRWQTVLFLTGSHFTSGCEISCMRKTTEAEAPIMKQTRINNGLILHS